MLQITDLTVRYGAATAIDGVSLEVGDGELVALVGPNGAGKSSLVNAVSGVVRPASGEIELGGRSAQVPEGRQMFPDLSVDDNLRLGAWRLHRRERDTSRVYELFPELAPLRTKHAGLLSGGQQQMVAIGRALMAKPELLLVDELSLGLAPLVTERLAEYLLRLNAEQGLSVLLIEQEVDLAFEVCSRAYVLEAGRVVASGDAATLRDDPTLTSVYFGDLEAKP